MFTIKLFTEAEINITEACKWYENKKTGLANKFLKEVDYYLNLIMVSVFHTSRNPIDL